MNVGSDSVSFFTKHPFTVQYKDRKEELTKREITTIIIASIIGALFFGIGSFFAFFGASYLLRTRAVKKLSENEINSTSQIQNTERVARQTLGRTSQSSSSSSSSSSSEEDGSNVVNQQSINSSEQTAQTATQQATSTSTVNPPIVQQVDDRLREFDKYLEGTFKYSLTIDHKTALLECYDQAMQNPNSKVSFAKLVHARQFPYRPIPGSIKLAILNSDFTSVENNAPYHSCLEEYKMELNKGISEEKKKFIKEICTHLSDATIYNMQSLLEFYDRAHGKANSFELFKEFVRNAGREMIPNTNSRAYGEDVLYFIKVRLAMVNQFFPGGAPPVVKYESFNQ